MPSKNRKKSWGHIPVSKEVGDYLSNINYDIRFGGPITSRLDSQLFNVSKTPNDVVQSPIHAKKIMRSWANLYPDPSITPIKQPTIASKTKYRPISTDVRKKGAVKLDRSVLRERKRARAMEWEMFREPIWEVKTSVNKTPDSDFVELIAKVTRPKLKVPQSVLHGRSEKRNSLLPAVLLPHPGASYRPEEDDHTQLLQTVRTGEKRRLRAEHKLSRSMRGMRYMSKRDIGKEERRQMREGLFEESERGSESDDNATLVTTSAHKQKVKKRKRKRKGVALERRRAILEHEKRKLDIRQSEDIKNIKSLIKQLDIQTASKKRRRSAPLTKRLGRLRYHEPIREFQLRSQIAPGLGRLVSEGNLLRDRYKSLQKRNIIEVRQKRRLKRKYQLKAYQKNSHKEAT